MSASLLINHIVVVLNGSEFGRRMRAAGLNQKQVAERTGLSASFICDVISGRRVAKDDTAKKIAALVSR